MRDGWERDPGNSEAVSGPYFGVLMTKGFNFQGDPNNGYIDAPLLIANNTFVMAQFGITDWIHEARNEAVALADVSSPGCSISPRDCDTTIRGLGHPGLINNVFRTKPGTEQMAMLGIDEDDTLVGDAPGVGIQTNAFATAKVGSDNVTFTSTVVGNSAISSPAGTTGVYQAAYWDCGGVSTTFPNPDCSAPCTPAHTCNAGVLPNPVVAIWDGSAAPTTERDPGFVGEFLAVTFQATFPEDYADWRLLPGTQLHPNPMKDRGYVPPASSFNMSNGHTYSLPTRPGAPDIFEWDGEYYGNPRIVDGSPDIGMDGIHLFTMAGSYAGDSRSHNVTGTTSGFLNPDPVGGRPDRYVIVRQEAGGYTLSQGVHSVHVNGQKQSPPAPPTVPTGWTQPPGTLQFPVVKTSLPADYDTKYIRFTNIGGVPTPWPQALTSGDFVQQYQPLAQATVPQRFDFVLFSEPDNECVPGPCEHWYFNTQVVIKDDLGNKLLRSNLQPEYR